MLEKVLIDPKSHKKSYKARYFLRYEYAVINGFKVNYGLEGVKVPKKALLVYIDDEDLKWLKLVIFRGSDNPNGIGWSCAEFSTGLKVNLSVAQNISEMDLLVDRVILFLKEKGREGIEKAMLKSVVINKM